MEKVLNVTEALGRWAADWKGTASTAAFETARMAVYDTIACMVAGAGDEGAANVRKTIAAWGDGRATIVGTSRSAAAPWTALANGTAAHAIDYDDGIHLGPVHVSAVLVPALLALAEESGASGRRVLEAYIVGVEVLGQVAQGVSRRHYLKGWHTTSTIGTIAAAAACGRLLGLDALALSSAIGLGASMASGMKAQFGSMAKPFHAGMAAKNGILAASLAANCLRAGKDPLDARFGFRWLYGTEESPGWREIIPKLGNPLAIEEHGVGAKYYPCCLGAHRTLDGVLELRKKHGFNAADVVSVETEVASSSAQNLMYPSPENEMQARFSMPYCVAVALHSGRVVLADFTQDAVARPQIRKLLPLVKMEGRAPAPNDESAKTRAPAIVRIVLNDGRVCETSVQNPLGSPLKPMSATQISEKFHDCTKGFLAPESVIAAEKILRTFGEAPSMSDLMRHLRFEAVADHGERFARRNAE